MLIGGDLEELQDYVARVRIESEKAGLLLNTKKMKIKNFNEIQQTMQLWWVDRFLIPSYGAEF